MKALLPFGLMALLFATTTGCREDDPIPPTPSIPGTATGRLQVRVVPEWEGSPLAFYTEYRNISDYRTTVEMLKLYLGDLRLMTTGDSTDVASVAYFDLEGGRDTASWSVPVGTYTALHTGLGVPEDVNHTDPALYGAAHPLSINNGTHWSWNSGYRFVLFEGRYSPDPASTDPLLNAYSLHTGFDTAYIELQLVPAQPITIVQGAITELVVRVSVDRFFHGAAGTVDLATENQAHGMNAPLNMKLSALMAASIHVD